MTAASAFVVSATIALGAGVANAATTVVVNETSLGVTWFTNDTNSGGSVAFVPDAGAPLGAGALQMATDSTTTAKAQLLTGNETGTPVADVTALGFSSKTIAGPAYAAPSFQFAIYVNGGTSGWTTMVYEPYENGTVTPGTWQTWDVAAGQFWSTRTVGPFVAGAGGTPFYTLAEIKAMAPNAVVASIGLNIGSNNPGYTVLADALVFNDVTYDFDPRVFVKDDCKNGGWATNWAAGTYINQGDCVSYFASGGKTHPQG